MSLGVKKGDGISIENPLNDQSEQAIILTNKGFLTLEEMNPAEALSLFREALRVNPDIGWARKGILLALSERSTFFRALDTFFHWLSYPPEEASIPVHIGMLVVPEFIKRASKAYPDLEPVFAGVLAALFAIVFLLMFPEAIHHLLIRLSRFGRWMLTPAQKAASNTVILAALAVIVCVIVWVITSETAALWTGLGIFLLFKPMSALYGLRAGRARRWMGVYTVLLCVFGLLSLLLYFLHANRTLILLLGTLFLVGGYISHAVKYALEDSEK